MQYEFLITLANLRDPLKGHKLTTIDLLVYGVPSAYSSCLTVLRSLTKFENTEDG